MRFWSGSRRWTERIFYVAPVRITRAITESRGRLAMKHRSSDPAVGEAEGEGGDDDDEGEGDDDGDDDNDGDEKVPSSTQGDSGLEEGDADEEGL